MDTSRSSRRGVWLVIGLLGFGLLLTGGLYVYLTLHRGPFLELTVALAEEFPDSAPHVEGGKRRLDEPGDRILRVVMKRPPSVEPGRESQIFAKRIARFIAGRDELARFDVLEIHLYTLIPGGEISEQSVRFTVAEAQSLTHNRDASN